ncbi:hypothetical protein KSP40_PGU019326 [Platanthera guangdongensis]|uniref:Uncharacterized protein n=1 Tax=Platanthera guangdongensis TaxID=2320717 RepID=A0ABR2MRK4_9ASPA
MYNSDAGQEVFFDSDDNIRTSVDSASSYFSVDEGHEFNLRILDAESWMGDMLSVQERRQKFFSTMEFGDFIVSRSDFSLRSDESALPKCIEPRLAKSNVASLDSFSESNDGRQEDSLYCIRNLDNGKVFTVHEHGDNGLPSMLKELGSDKILTYMEFEKLLGLHSSVRELMNRKVSPSEEKQCEVFTRRKKHRNWWRRLINQRHIVVMCKNDTSVKNSQLSRTMRTKVLRHRKRCIELTGLFIEQEFLAHKGSVRTMKFSPSGWYLASGGEDCIVRIWQIKEAETSCKCIVENGPANCFGKSKCSSLIGVKGSCASIVFPKKAFKILEKPLQEFIGHTGDILDVSWSASDFLLTSSMDKTVRLWKAGCNGCVRVFRHNDYVTCIQFNPVDERYFISGSIDGKVRIWGVSKNLVVDWADIRDIVTAVCYRPDGKGFVVGSINGNCHFFEFLAGNSLQTYMQFSIEGKHKSAGKRVTGLQFSPEDAQQIMITSADSKVRIFDGFGIVHKFRGNVRLAGLRKTKSHLSASFTSNGRHIVSVGEDSTVYIWNYDFSRKPSARGAKSIRSFELFFSKGASVAVPWPNMPQKMSGPRDGSFHPPPSLKILEPSTWLSNSVCFFLGSWLFADGASRVGPAEKLPLSAEADCGHLGNYRRELNHHYQQLTSLAAMWSMGIATAGSDGFIRSYHNYGLPVWS